ncbi:MAG: PAS domain-containing protein, partial [Sulfurimonas sp.]
MRTRLKDYFSFINSDFFNLGPMVSFVCKNDEGWSIETVSANIKENFFYEAQELLSGKVVYADLVHKDDLKRVTNEVATASEERKKSFTHEAYRIKNGRNEYRWVQDTTTIYYDDNGNITHYVGYIIDITESENNHLLAIENEEKLQKAQELEHLGNWELDIVNDQLYWSVEVYKLFEIDEKMQPSYELFLETIHPDDRELVDQVYTDSIEKKQRY